MPEGEECSPNLRLCRQGHSHPPPSCYLITSCVKSHQGILEISSLVRQSTPLHRTVLYNWQRSAHSSSSLLAVQETPDKVIMEARHLSGQAGEGEGRGKLGQILTLPLQRLLASDLRGSSQGGGAALCRLAARNSWHFSSPIGCLKAAETVP